MKTGALIELNEDVYAVKSVWMARSGLFPTYSFLLYDGERKDITVFDTGGPGSGRLILDAVKKLGYRPEAVTAVALSHWHRDHTGGLAELADNIPGQVEIFMNRTDREIFAAGRRKLLWMHPVLKTFVLHKPGKMPETDNYKFIDVDKDSSALSARGITAIHTPGHTPGHTSYLHEKTGSLFAGCGISLLGKNTAGLVPVHLDREKQLKSGRMITEMEFKFFYPVHMYINKNQIGKEIRVPFEGKPSLIDRITGSTPLFRYPRT